MVSYPGRQWRTLPFGNGGVLKAQTGVPAKRYRRKRTKNRPLLYLWPHLLWSRPLWNWNFVGVLDGPNPLFQQLPEIFSWWYRTPHWRFFSRSRFNSDNFFCNDLVLFKKCVYLWWLSFRKGLRSPRARQGKLSGFSLYSWSYLKEIPKPADNTLYCVLV